MSLNRSLNLIISICSKVQECSQEKGLDAHFVSITSTSKETTLPRFQRQFVISLLVSSLLQSRLTSRGDRDHLAIYSDMFYIPHISVATLAAALINTINLHAPKARQQWDGAERASPNFSPSCKSREHYFVSMGSASLLVPYDTLPWKTRRAVSYLFLSCIFGGPLWNFYLAQRAENIRIFLTRGISFLS